MDPNDVSFLKKYLARIICTVVFLVIGLLIATVGIIKAVFIIAVAIAGYFVGHVLDDKDALRRIINNYLGRF